MQINTSYLSGIKKSIKRGLSLAGIDITRNMAYDRLTRQIMKSVLNPGSVCVDIGSHSGEVLEQMLLLAPKGRHFAFEPIPHLYEKLLRDFGDKAVILPYALSDREELTDFNFVRNAPAYSGLKKRKYNMQRPDIEQICVQTRMLDSVIDSHISIDFIKIDVEGAEYSVIKGARQIIKRCRPYIIFEFGIGASEFYEKGPDDMFELLVNDCGLSISSLKQFICNQGAYYRDRFRSVYNSGSEYYFIAHP